MVDLRGILMQREHLAVVAESNVDPGFSLPEETSSSRVPRHSRVPVQ